MHLSDLKNYGFDTNIANFRFLKMSLSFALCSRDARGALKRLGSSTTHLNNPENYGIDPNVCCSLLHLYFFSFPVHS